MQIRHSCVENALWARAGAGPAHQKPITTKDTKGFVVYLDVLDGYVAAGPKQHSECLPFLYNRAADKANKVASSPLKGFLPAGPKYFRMQTIFIGSERLSCDEEGT
jgi:hypothetical protein